MASLTFPDAHLHVFPGLDNLAPGSFINATSEDDWQACLGIADTTEGTAFLGVHPWFLDDQKPGWQDRLTELAKNRSIGIGEIGLDTFRGPSKEEQLRCFEFQFELAMECHRPVSLHCVKRWDTLLEVLRRHAPFASNVMVHGFCGSSELQTELIDLGCYLSFGFQIVENREKAVNAWRSMPEDRLFLETDAPSGLLRPGRAPAGYCAGVGKLLVEAAALRSVSPESLAGALAGSITT
jgi:TatD DNase family protein